MTVRLYRSTDASAPVLSGTNGSLLTVLDAVLVNGYGALPAAGWTIAYTGTNVRQYAMAAGGTGCQLYINDAGPGAGVAREAFFCGFKTGTGIGTGTGQFPTLAQLNIGIGQCVIRKSTTADATARPWYIIASGNTIYMFIETGDYVAPIMTFPWMFGDVTTYSLTDTSNCAIIGRVSTNNAASVPASTYTQSGLYDAFGHISNVTAQAMNSTLPGHYLAGQYTNVGGSIPVGKHTDSFKMGTYYFGQMGYCGTWTTGSNSTGTIYPNVLNYPNPADGGLYTAPVWVHHTGGVRGYYRGMWAPLQHMPLNHLDTYSGTGNLAGRSFISINMVGISQGSPAPLYTPIQVHMEYSDTWN